MRPLLSALCVDGARERMRAPGAVQCHLRLVASNTLPRDGHSRAPAGFASLPRPPPHPCPTLSTSSKALGGGSVDVPSLDNRILRVPLKEVVRPGYERVVSGEGARKAFACCCLVLGLGLIVVRGCKRGAASAGSMAKVRGV